MATKTITIKEEAYNRLLAHKKPDESFSDEIIRHFSKKPNIMDFCGTWSDISDKEAEKMKREIYARRKGTRQKEIEQAWKR